MRKLWNIIGIGLCVWSLSACKKDAPKNPYDEIETGVQNDNPDPDQYPEGSFGWLHGKVFSPTCANSGCHDGTFEPDFRTISSSYYSLVNHPVVANDEAGSFNHRVVPGNVDASFLHERLTVEIPNTSGMMPLAAEDDPSWNANSSFYIQKIRDWISAGAPDMAGNPAPSAGVNGPPLVYGMAIFPVGNTTNPYPRETDSPYGIGSITVPAGLVDVWILPFDDNAFVNGFESASMKVSSSLSDFSNAISADFALQSTPLTALDFGDNPNPFYYKTTIDLSSFESGEICYVRNYIDDGVQPALTEVPNNASNAFWYLIFSLKIQ
jgi:hypothetical protein